MERYYWDTRCKCCWSFVVAALLLCSSGVPATVAQSHPDFLNIDCGATDSYVDPVTGLTWVPDTAYISTGKLQKPAVPSNLQNFTELNGLRYFDDLRAKNCFTLPVVRNSGYLLRVTFFYGNYDNKNQPPSFQLGLDATVLENVSPPTGDDAVYGEYHYMSQGNASLLCLLRTSPEQSPFISGISLKPASATKTGYAGGYLPQYATLLQQMQVMKTRLRVSYGDTKLIRGPDDFYDRFWFPESPTANYYLAPTTSPKVFLSTTTQFSYLLNQASQPPSIVMQTAVSSNSTLASLLLPPGTKQTNETAWYVAVYLAELVQYTGTPVPRNFTINVLGKAPYADNLAGEFEVGYNYNEYNSNYQMEANDTITMTTMAGALNGPILNAMEVFAVSDPMKNKTYQRDALAIEDIKKELNLTEWTGDPCLPIPHDWISCSPDDGTLEEPQITSVNLTGYNLQGSIPASFANLVALTRLSLENNSLSGTLPDFFTTALKDLEVLSIQNNNFSGTIPQALLATNSPIRFTYRPGNPLLVVSSSVPPSSKKSSNVGVIVGATIGGILGVVLILVLAIIAHRRCKRKAPKLSEDEGASIMKIPYPGGAKAYSRAEVDVATNHLNRELGRGGFGPVYYGILPDGQEVAVKVADKSSSQGEKEFFNEVDVLSRVHHRNLVALLGYCQSGRDSILIYEYVSNGSLFDHLHGTAGKSNALNWKRRLHIGLNAAQGLEYLHTGCSPSFIHRDVKSGNILLTPKFEAKVADFGLARLMGETEGTRVLTNVMGTAGYLDPEYYTTQYIHTKSDVYSFGIVLLELITGRPPIDQTLTAMGKNPHIAHWVRESLQNDDMHSILAPAVKASNPNMGSVWKVAEIAMQSVEPKSAHRPSMTEVVQELQGALTLEGAAPESYSGRSDNSSKPAPEFYSGHSDNSSRPAPEFYSGHSDYSSRPEMEASSFPMPR